MIKADNGHVAIHGSGLDVIVDYMAITDALLNECDTPRNLLIDAFDTVIGNERYEDVEKSREGIKEIFKGACGDEIMQDLVNMMKEVVGEDD